MENVSIIKEPKDFVTHLLIRKIFENGYHYIVVSNRTIREDKSIKFRNFAFMSDIENSDEQLYYLFQANFEKKVNRVKLNEKFFKDSHVFLEGFDDNDDFVNNLIHQIKSSTLEFEITNRNPYISEINMYEAQSINHIKENTPYTAKETSTPKDTLCVYTDASVKEKETAVGIGGLIRKPDSDKVIYEMFGKFEMGTENIKSFNAESLSILEIMKMIKEKMEQKIIDENLNIEFRLDNLETVKDFFRLKNNQDVKKEKTVQQLFEYSKKFNGKIDLKWTSGHCKNPYNNKADELAKKGWELDIDNILNIKKKNSLRLK